MRTSTPQHKGSVLYHVGEAADRCHVARSGVFKSISFSVTGEEFVTGFYYPGELIGLNGRATGRYQDTAVALDTSTTCGLNYRDLPRLWAVGSGDSLLRMLAQHEHDAMQHQINLSQSRAEARIAGFLLLLSDRLRRLGWNHLTLPTPMSRTDLANYLGITLECLSRELGKFKRAGLIGATRASITLCRPDELTTLALHLSR